MTEQTTTPARTSRHTSLARLLGSEVADELRGILREPTALMFSILMPVGFFALFVSMFGDESLGPVPGGTRMLATFGTFGVLAVTLLNPGIGVAADREIGWLRAKRVSAVPVGITLTAKVIAAQPYAVGVLAAMTLAAWLTGTLEASPGELAWIAAVLLLGGLPFALIGMAVGFRASSSATAAILNAVLMPSAVVSGLWMPLEILPGFFADLARFLPPYHLAQLAVAQLDGVQLDTTLAGHVLVMLATAATMAALAGLSYRRAKL